MPVGICKFCGQEKQLIGSHVIPKCFYQFKKLGSGGLHTVNMRKNKIEKDPRQQNGMKEPLMCKECDTALGKLDGYANKILFKVIPNLPSLPTDTGKVYTLSGDKFDYDQLRLFFISLIWRVSVSSFPFSLGKYEKIALQILKGEIPDNDKLFFPFIYRRNTKLPPDFVSGIFPGKYKKKTICYIKFPNYEIGIFPKPNDNTIMDDTMKLFTRERLVVYEINTKTKTDCKFANGYFACQKEPNIKPAKD